MKKLQDLLGLHKPDEMERYILAKSQRNAYIFLALALMLWSFYESYKVYAHGSRLNPFPCLLLGGAVLVQGFSQLALARRAVKDNEDSLETGPLIRIIILVCVIVCIIATAGAALLLLGART